MGVIGTLGTADTKGTARLLPIGVNEATGAMFVQDLSGASGTTNITGTVAVSNVEKGTVTRIEGGSIIITNGTVNVTAGSVVQTAGTVTTGSLTNLATLGTILNVDKGTISRLEGGSVVVTTGTIGDLDTVGTVGVVNSGSMVITTGTIADMDTVGTVGRVEGGSIVVTLGTVLVTNGTTVQASGTLTTGSLTNVATVGTLLNQDKGTITRLEGGSVVVTVGTTTVTTGSIVQTAGTMTTGSLTNLATVGTLLNQDKGTITRLEGGSVVVTVGTTTVTTGSIVQTAGTVTTGSIVVTVGTVRQNWRPTAIGSTFGTLATAAGSVFGTLVPASGAGTEIMVAGLSIIAVSGTPDVRILIGTAITGASVLAGGAIVAGAGREKTFTPPLETAANSEITYHFVGAGTAYINLHYWNEA